jgi:tripartite-type tricarboxylate transporter receptor subunit TctC
VASAPDVPTTTEVGMPDLQTENWYGMVAPAGTPPDIVAVLNKATIEAMKDPDVAAKLSSQGAILEPQTPEQFRAFIASEIAKWAKVIKAAGITTEN